MQLDTGRLESYLLDVAEHLERYGVVLDLEPGADLALDETPSGALAFEIRGFLPDGRQPPGSVVEVRELWRPVAQGRYERSEYAYELIDHERDYRLAFHLHDADAFVRLFRVVVHEHCERPVGRAPCEHYAGLPVRDAFAGVERLVRMWVDPQKPDCGVLTCLEGS